MQEWMHYSRTPLDESPLPCLPSEPCIHATNARYYAPGSAWRDWAARYLTDRGYTHRYRLENCEKLHLLHIDSTSIGALSLGEWFQFDWETVRKQGYDGVYVHREQLLKDKTTPVAWRLFASSREHDEIIVWANDAVTELVMDWPRRNERRKTRTD